MKNTLILLLLLATNVFADCDEFESSISRYVKSIQYVSSLPDGRNKLVDFYTLYYEQKLPKMMQKFEETKKSLSDSDVKLFEIMRQIILDVHIESERVSLNSKYFSELMGLAKEGHIDSQTCLSVLYQYGLGTGADLVKAYAWAATAAAQNPPFGEKRREVVASTLDSSNQSEAIEMANSYMRVYTNLFDEPTLLLIK